LRGCEVQKNPCREKSRLEERTRHKSIMVTRQGISSALYSTAENNKTQFLFTRQRWYDHLGIFIQSPGISASVPLQASNILQAQHMNDSPSTPSAPKFNNTPNIPSQMKHFRFGLVIFHLNRCSHSVKLLRFANPPVPPLSSCMHLQCLLVPVLFR